MKNCLICRVKKYLFDKESGFFREMSAFGNFIVLSFLMFLFFGYGNTFLEIYVYFVMLEIFICAIKVIFYKDRPKKEKYSNIIEKISASSFPSSHSARSLFVFLLIFSLLGGIERLFLVCIPMAVGFSRVLIKKHYVIDVVVGYVIGAIFFLCYIIL